MVGSFTHQRVDEIGSTKSTSDQRVDVSAVGCPDFDISSDVGEDVLVTHADESEFTEIGMGSEILTRISVTLRVHLQSVKRTTKKPKSLVLVVAVSAVLIPPSVIDTFKKTSPDQCLGSIPMTLFYS